MAICSTRLVMIIFSLGSNHILKNVLAPSKRLLSTVETFMSENTCKYGHKGVLEVVTVKK